MPKGGKGEMQTKILITYAFHSIILIPAYAYWTPCMRDFAYCVKELHLEISHTFLPGVPFLSPSGEI